MMFRSLARHVVTPFATSSRPLTLALAGLSALAGANCGLEDISNVPEVVLGHCVYINRFSKDEECREYLGDAWNEGAAAENCDGEGGTFAWGTECSYTETLGRCVMNANEDDVYQIQIPGADSGDCASSRRGCEFFGGGVWDPAEPCGGSPEDEGIPSEDAFQLGEVVCMDPLPGEEPGMSEDGQVCTREMISSSTEEGRKYIDYASCEPVYTQRPYYPVNPNAAVNETSESDPRLEDEEYMEELAWVKSQIEASACVCCHSEEIAPEGTSNWYIEAGPLWIDSFYPSGLALGAGWISSVSFGAWPPEENNGFSREHGFPTTDEDRMRGFFQIELNRLGYTADDFKDSTPFGGPLHEQMIYEPGRCENGEGVNEAGRVVWTGGPARYVYILESGAANPGTPPNLDVPEGTVWFTNVPWTEKPIKSGVGYGEVLDRAIQRVPADGAPPALQSGEEYYLYVLSDMGIPANRCLFTAP